MSYTLLDTIGNCRQRALAAKVRASVQVLVVACKHQWRHVVLQGIKPSIAFSVLNPHAAADAVCGAPAQALAAAEEPKHAHLKDAAGTQLDSASDREVCHTLSIRGGFKEFWIHFIQCCPTGALHSGLMFQRPMHVFIVQVKRVKENDLQSLSRELQQLSQVNQELSQQLDQVLAHYRKRSDSNTALAHQMGQMQDMQVAMIGMMTEMYKNQMQSRGTKGHVGRFPVPLQALVNVSEQGLPKAVQECLQKERNLHERQHQQQVERAKANMQALKDQIPGRHSSSESAEEEVACPSTNYAHASTSADMQCMSTSGAAELLCSDQVAHCPEPIVPGKNRLPWTEWLGKHVGISGQHLHNATQCYIMCA